MFFLHRSMFELGFLPSKPLQTYFFSLESTSKFMLHRDEYTGNLEQFSTDGTKTGFSSVDRSAVEPEFSHPIAKYAFQYALVMK